MTAVLVMLLAAGFMLRTIPTNAGTPPQKWRIVGAVEELQRLSDDFNLARLQARIGAAVAFADDARRGQDVLAAKAISEFEHLGRTILGVEHHLRHAVAVAHVDKDEPVAMPARRVNPAGERDGLVNVFAAKFAAGVRSDRGAGGVHGVRVFLVLNRAASIASMRSRAYLGVYGGI